MPTEEAPLFDAAARRPHPGQPLAERLRPRQLGDVLGQGHLLGPRGILSATLARGVCPSVILVGPPGCGKTTVARLLAAAVGADFEELSAVAAGLPEVREVVARARRRRGAHARATVLFLDEIHRFNRAQQDGLLPHVECGVVALVGATTQNPYRALEAALRSRCRVLRLEPLGEADQRALLARGLEALASAGGAPAKAVSLAREAEGVLLGRAGGDGRRLLAVLEAADDVRRADGRGDIRAEDVVAAEPRGPVDLDAPARRADLVSAFIKAMRASDPDAALYYMARLLDGGEDPRFLARRAVIFASEDVGNADPQALGVACHAAMALEEVGMPEGRLPLTQVCTYLACAPKSHAVAVAAARAVEIVAAAGDATVPRELCPGARHYRYPPEHAVDGYDCLPASVPRTAIYTPSDRGGERAIAERLAAWRRRHRPGSPAAAPDARSRPRGGA